jgi:hypothetical protein
MATKRSSSKHKAASILRKDAKKKPHAKAQKAPKGKPAGQAARPVVGDRTATNLLARAEADMTALLDSLNNQMANAMNAITELAVSQRGPHEAIIRTRPIDRATAMFQRLVADVLDDKLTEILPTLVALRGEMNQRAGRAASSGSGPPGDGDFFERGTAMLDQVLSTLEARPFEPRVGDPFDPLIHLAVGETHRDDLRDGVLAEVLQPGFRTARGKVIVAARVKVNRR